MKELTSILILVAILAGVFYLLVQMELSYQKRCIEAGGTPIPGKTMCLRRDMVVIPR